MTALILFVTSLIAIWLSAGHLIESFAQLANRLRLPQFTLAFFVLGMLTSLPEMAITLSSLWLGDPSIAAGNLIGGIMVLFLLVIPLLALSGKKLKFPTELNQLTLFLVLIVVGAPTLLSADGHVTQSEGILLVLLYGALALAFRWQPHWLRSFQTLWKKPPKSFSPKKELLRVGLGMGVLLLASQVLVEQTITLATLLHVPPFLMSLLVVSLGTNAPEMTLVIRSFFSKHKDVALGDLLGSATVNTLLFGLMTIAQSSSWSLPNHALPRVGVILFALIIFGICSRTNHSLSRREGGLLLTLYFIFVGTQVWVAVQ